MGRRVLVCGGRNYSDRFKVYDTLDDMPTPSVIIHGCGGEFDEEKNRAVCGADWLAHDWATTAGVPVEKYPADWKGLKRAAGPIRNSQMLREGKPDLVIAFPGGPGTFDMVTKARRAGVEVREID